MAMVISEAAGAASDACAADAAGDAAAAELSLVVDPEEQPARTTPSVTAAETATKCLNRMPVLHKTVPGGSFNQSGRFKVKRFTT